MSKAVRTGGLAPECRMRRKPAEVSVNMEDKRKSAADLYWLACLLTGDRTLSIEIASDAVPSDNQENPFFATWMRSWSRRIVIAKALAAIRDDLAASARRTMLAGEQQPALPYGWSLGPEMTKGGIEKALLAIDAFPRAAVLLLVFERIRLADAATLLDADANLVRKAQAIGLRELTANLAGITDFTEPALSEPLALAQPAS